MDLEDYQVHSIGQWLSVDFEAQKHYPRQWSRPWVKTETVELDSLNRGRVCKLQNSVACFDRDVS